ncbi:hypothetical protein H2200_012173 [Cladophialophora chaetospira]|uniref:Aminoglycoside phosphotransferase domain-containing protein n=1 Tax=Cladophialophora chaetospira TaxID=386627 RepID=A0AA39CCP5_9EURO|nr:hypothetical protein H2200_012173 [Cladophialophora chaetospira]
MDHLTPAIPFRTAERLTPRANPNYDIYFSDEKIKSVVERCLANVKKDQMTIGHLPTGKSFNNRIYFINLNEPWLNTRPEWKPEDKEVEVAKSKTQIQSSFLVLKIAGHPFGRNKVQNEVACLLLLEKYCPSVPCPKLIAWSDDGKKVRTPEFPRGFRENEVKSVPVLAIEAENDKLIENPRKDTEGQGWMLLTREPGKPVSPEDLSGKAGDELMRQIAVHVATWRKDMPTAKAVGNLRIVGSGSQPGPAAVLYDKSILPGYDVHIDGLITNSSPQSPLGSAEKYAAFSLKSSLKKLKEGKLYGSTSDEVYDMVKRFLDVSLPKLPMFRYAFEPMLFTHDDLSTRNVLALPHGNGGAKVSSIIDFEFAGFFPKDEEFANCLQNDNLEWPLKKYGSFLDELKNHEALPEALAAKIPAASALGNASDMALEFGTSDFHQATLMLRLCINAAPWWIKEEKEFTPEKLEEEMVAAKARVANAITWLEGTIPETPEKGEGRRRSRASSTVRPSPKP